jgi:hypothetical protein
MIELRRNKDADLRKLPHPSEVPGFLLWRTPEYVIYSIIRNEMLLALDGLSESEAVERIDKVRRLNLICVGAQSLTVEQYIDQVLSVYFSRYLEHGVDLRNAAIKLAKAHVQLSAGLEGGAYPPIEWLSWKMDRAEFDRKFANRPDASQLLMPSSNFDIDFVEFIIRLRDDDELWRFSSPPESWEMMMGRGGIALVRDGRPITYLGTVMN